MNHPVWKAAAVWLLAVAAMAVLDGRVELANLALVLVLAAALASLWLPPWAALALPAAAVLGFNFAFVPPRGSFNVNLHHHALLLLTLLAVSWTISLLMARQRRLLAAERQHAQRAAEVQRLGEALREGDDPRQQAPALQALLSGLGTAPAALMMVAGQDSQPHDADACLLQGEANADERTGLWLCLVQGLPMGPGTGRHEEQPAWYLPLRGHGPAHPHAHAHPHAGGLGAALLRQPPAEGEEAALRRAHAQALCDQMGLAIERAQATARATAAAAEAQGQQLRNTLLAAISHDYRTPLATILGAASSLHDQGARLTTAQQQRLAATIVEQTEQLSQLTTNTLQLARLGAAGDAGLPPLPMDWESAEEIAGSVLHRHRQRHPEQPLKLRIEPGLPLLRCDAVLLGQLLDNLVLNALSHGRDASGQANVELRVHRVASSLVLAVRDRGPGVPLASRERIFSVFERGEPQPAGQELGRGAGVGLAVCRAIARAHGGELRYRARAHGGASFECVLPLAEPPVVPHEVPHEAPNEATP